MKNSSVYYFVNSSVYYFVNSNGVKELIYHISSVRRHINNTLTTYGHGNLQIPVIEESNVFFKDQMQIIYDVKKPPMFKSVNTGTLYPIFRSEFKKILEKTIIIKGVVEINEWTIRSHGGMYSIKLAN